MSFLTFFVNTSSHHIFFSHFTQCHEFAHVVAAFGAIIITDFYANKALRQLWSMAGASHYLLSMRVAGRVRGLFSAGCHGHAIVPNWFLVFESHNVM